MAGNTFGHLFRITTFGESHGAMIGVVIDGCPSGVEIDLNEISKDLDRRKPGQSSITTSRKEKDSFDIVSGVFEGQTTGTPITILIPNKDTKPGDYDHIKDKFRPSHADFTYQAKYGVRDYRGGGRSSARETACRVAAGAIAKQLLKAYDLRIYSYVSQVGDVSMKLDADIDTFDTENIVRCPDADTADKMIKLIKKIKKEGDSIGGVVSTIIKNIPAGLGEPVFDRLDADLAKAMLSINATKAFEYGSGFAGVSMKGSEHNDVIYKNEEGAIKTRSNHSGGILGGISNGMDIYFKVAFKPVATIMKDQKSLDKEGNEITVKGKGRHDPCVVPRAVPIVEAMAALVMADHLLRAKALH
jgi:chorismate synthase